MLHQFQSHIHKLCKTTDKILLAVSGGLDSMVMLQLFHQAGYSVSVAHCNFQLRGDESAEDKKFVEEICKHRSIPFYSYPFDTKNYAKQHGLSIQMAARELRYAWFNELLIKEGFDFIATAHHLHDSIETVLLNLTKGTGIAGLKGIALQNNKIIRPLLFFTREVIEIYAAEQGVTWREDHSNQSDEYQRNFIRHQIIPQLKEINPSLEKTFLETMMKMQGTSEIVDGAIEQWKKEYQKIEGDKIIFDKRGLLAHSPHYNATLMWELLKKYGFNFDQCENLIISIASQSGKKFISATHELVVDRTHLMLTPSPPILQEVLIHEGQPEAVLGRIHLDIRSLESTTIVPDPSMACLDSARLNFPLLWRKWKEGDYFYPLGMNHRKKLSDFLINEKISVIDKEFLTIIASQSEIVWVVGHRIDDRFKVTSETKQVFQMKIS